MISNQNKNQTLRRKGALEIIEEAVHLLRMAPARVLCLYYLGSLPFVLALLFFWAEMSRSAFASGRCAKMAFFVAALYLWMKCWQAIYAGQLRQIVSGSAPRPWNLKRILYVLTSQTIFQPSSLVLLPIAALVTLPFGWVYAFYQNISVFGDGGEKDSPRIFRKSGQLASLWPGQNHLLIAILQAFGLFVFLNLVTAMFLLPWLAKMLFGLESAFTLSRWSYLNTTFFAIAGGLTYLCVNPLTKAAYVLRCFYGSSLQTGEDLKADCSMFRFQIQKSVLVGLAVLFIVAPLSFGNEAVEVSAGKERKLAMDLDHSIREVIERPEYSWRFPRALEVEKEEPKGIFGMFFDEAADVIGGWFRSIKKWGMEVWYWIAEQLEKLTKGRRPSQKPDSETWIPSVQSQILLSILLVAGVLGVFLLRFWKRRPDRSGEVTSQAVAMIPDLTKEEVRADLLPSDEWQLLAQNLLERGEFRLALRAFYLASLAYLSQRELLTIANFKSNRDYRQELERKARTKPELLSAFVENISLFERAWYGMHDVDTGIVNLFTANHERIKTCAGP